MKVMKRSPSQTSSDNKSWKSTAMGVLLVVAGLVQLVACNGIDGNYLVYAHSIGLLICLCGSRQLLHRTNSWARIIGGGLIVGLVHGTWAFLFTSFPPAGAAPNYFRGTEGAVIMFVMWSLFTGFLATIAAGIFEAVSLIRRSPR